MWSRVLVYLTGLLFLVPGFVMSIVWFYAIANELVALLVASAVVLHVRSAILGLTLLAWGNSVGDLVANLALAYTGGREGVQIAWSGCFAGPMFNMLVGLGASLVMSAARSYPSSFPIPEDPTLPWTMLFLLASLLVSLAILTVSKFRLSRTLGVSLLLVYAAFFVVRLLDMMNIVPLPMWWGPH